MNKKEEEAINKRNELLSMFMKIFIQKIDQKLTKHYEKDQINEIYNPSQRQPLSTESL